MANIKMTVLVREDLKLPTGLLTAQVAHIAMEKARQFILDERVIKDHPEFKDWLISPYIYIHSVPNWEWLKYYSEKAKTKGIEVNEWRDTLYLQSSPTQQQAFENVLVGISFGPTDSDKIKSVIGDLPLLR
jgi:peptidyl-tRNA hydrolase